MSSAPTNEYISGESAGVSRSASVDHHMAPLDEWMEDHAITEVCINRPGEVWCERNCVWETHKVASLTDAHLRSLSTAIAKFARNEISETRPILSAVLPRRERIQIVWLPAPLP